MSTYCLLLKELYFSLKPTPGYGQMVMQQGPFIGQAGVIQPGMMTRGVGQQAGIIPGMGQQNIQGQQNMTPEQLK